jgi:hypothetical protein
MTCRNVSGCHFNELIRLVGRLALKVHKESKLSRVGKVRLAVQEQWVSKVSKASKECRGSKVTRGRRVPMEQVVPRDRLEK